MNSEILIFSIIGSKNPYNSKLVVDEVVMILKSFEMWHPFGKSVKKPEDGKKNGSGSIQNTYQKARLVNNGYQRLTTVING